MSLRVRGFVSASAIAVAAFLWSPTGSAQGGADCSKPVTAPANNEWMNTEVDITVLFDDGRAYQMKNAFRYLDATDNTKVMKNFGGSLNTAARGG